MNLSDTFIRVKNRAMLPVIFVAALWAIQIINSAIFGQSLTSLGILPRTQSGLTGILFAPFLHANYGHLIGNSFMLILLSWIICFYDVKAWVKSLAFGTIIGGLITWFIGSYSYHIGASILIFSLWGTILGIAIFHKKPFFIIASLILMATYGVSMIYGLIPQEQVSLAGHLGGLIAGFACAKHLRYNKQDMHLRTQ